MESLFNTKSYSRITNGLGILGVTISIVSVPLMIQGVFPGILMMLSALSLSSCYFILRSFAQRSFVHRFIDIGFAVLVIGLIFFMMHWPGAESMALVSSGMFRYIAALGAIDLFLHRENAYFELQKLLMFTLLGCCILTSYYVESLPA